MQHQRSSGKDTDTEQPHAVVVLPRVGGGQIGNAGLRRWLSQSRLELARRVAEPLARIAEALGLEYPQQGRAALRLLGQTGNRLRAWIAAADPVYLEPGLDHLRLHALSESEVTGAELRALFDHLQATLANDPQVGFLRVGPCGYVTRGEALATASVSAAAITGRLPNEFMPSGYGAASYRNLLGEIEMTLHDHDVNQRRIADGQPPVNSLWLWGGGVMPGQENVPCPPLFADDPLVKGYWQQLSARIESWSGSIGACLAASTAGFVAMPPEHEAGPNAIESWLGELRDALARGRLDRVTLLFADGLRADVRHSDRLRFWRREHAHFGLMQ